MTAIFNVTERDCPIRIRTILTDNGKEFADRLFGLRRRAESRKHEFDKLCTALEIEHRLTPPRSPQTKGMVQRFNGRIEDVLQSHLSSNQAKSWKPRCTATSGSTTSNFRNQHWAARRPCKL
jgi:transposase InsO family protein